MVSAISKLQLLMLGLLLASTSSNLFITAEEIDTLESVAAGDWGGKTGDSYLLFLMLDEHDITITKEENQQMTSSGGAAAVSGKHLRILPSTTNYFPAVMVERDPVDGTFISVTGVVKPILEWLAADLNFTFEFADEFDGSNSLEDAGPNGKPGEMSFMLQGRVDMLLGMFMLHEKRNQLADFPYPWAKTVAALMIPSAKIDEKTQSSFSKVDAVWKPFQMQVWLCLAISLLVATTSLYGLSRCLSFFHSDRDNKDQGSLLTPKEEEKRRIFSAIGFTFKTILLQSGPIKNGIGNMRQRRSLVIRVMTGAWCLSCFILITAYCSVLISFLTEPDKLKPIINSVEDLIKHPEIRVNVVKGWGPDVTLKEISKNIAEGKPVSSAYKHMANQLKDHPEQRCDKIDQCLDQVRESCSVFVSDYMSILGIIGVDLKKTSRCDFSVAKEHFTLVLAGIVLPKNGPYTQEFSLAIMKMEQFGLIDHWWRQYSPADPKPCLSENIDKKKKDETNGNRKRLTLKDLSGAFVLLVAGYFLSLLVFIIERSIGRMKKDYYSNKTAAPLIQIVVPAVVGIETSANLKNAPPSPVIDKIEKTLTEKKIEKAGDEVVPDFTTIEAVATFPPSSDKKIEKEDSDKTQGPSHNKGKGKAVEPTARKARKGPSRRPLALKTVAGKPVIP